jgi:hypothetical protein
VVDCKELSAALSSPEAIVAACRIAAERDSTIARLQHLQDLQDRREREARAGLMAVAREREEKLARDLQSQQDERMRAFVRSWKLGTNGIHKRRVSPLSVNDT